MKKISVLFMLFSVAICTAQLKQIEESKSNLIEVGKIQPLGMPIQMSCITDSEKKFYGFTYLDTEYKQLKEYKKFALVETGNDFDTLYNMIIEGLKAKEEKSIKLELKENIIWVNFVRSFGMTLVTFSSINGKNESLHKGTSNMFTKKQIDKLFGKK